MSWGYCVFLFHCPFNWAILLQCLRCPAGPRLRLLVIVSSCMPIVHCLHIVCFLYLFLLLDLWRLSAIPEDPARRQKLCFSQSCFSLKQEGPLQKPSLQWCLNQSSLILVGFHLLSSKKVVSINIELKKERSLKCLCLLCEIKKGQ